jgi:hypothetical protein
MMLVFVNQIQTTTCSITYSSASPAHPQTARRQEAKP